MIYVSISYCYQGKILAVLKENGLTTLVDLITKAGLAQTLSGEGKYMVSLYFF